MSSTIALSAAADSAILLDEQKQAIRDALSRHQLAISNINAFMMNAISDPRQKYWHPSWIEPDPHYRRIRIEHTKRCLTLAMAHHHHDAACRVQQFAWASKVALTKYNTLIPFFVTLSWFHSVNDAGISSKCQQLFEYTQMSTSRTVLLVPILHTSHCMSSQRVS